MSYCRFSTDDYQSDVYVYESDAGWMTHVANYRYVFTEPLPAPVDDTKAWVERYVKVSEMVDRAERREIGLSRDGGTFTDATPGDCAKRLRELREEGYRIPDGVIELLEKEQGER